MSLRHHLARALVGLGVLLTALVSVGLTAPADGPFSLAIHPVFMHIDPAAIVESRARALGVDIDVKLGGLHLHLGWSAVPLSPTSTKPESSSF